MNAQFRFINAGSEEYTQSHDLRDRVLRQPLGLSLYDEDLSEEEQDKHLCGFVNGKLISVLILIIKDHEAKMRQVAVEDGFQGMGIGKAMVQFAETWLISNGIKRVYCHARDVAVPFYLGMGYSSTGEPFVEVGITHFKMQKTLQ